MGKGKGSESKSELQEQVLLWPTTTRKRLISNVGLQGSDLEAGPGRQAGLLASAGCRLPCLQDSPLLEWKPFPSLDETHRQELAPHGKQAYLVETGRQAGPHSQSGELSLSRRLHSARVPLK